ncbi:hypothetical protein, partial [Brasilonema octagenarum]
RGKDFSADSSEGEVLNEICVHRSLDKGDGVSGGVKYIAAIAIPRKLSQRNGVNIALYYTSNM